MHEIEIEAERAAVRLELRAFGSEPLTRGFVESSADTEAGAYARCRCVLEGTRPNESYEVTLLVHPFDPTCSNVPARFVSVALDTDEAGDGTADLVIRPEDVPTAFRSATHGLRWTVAWAGSPVFQTDCSTVTPDALASSVSRPIRIGRSSRHRRNGASER